ncbi:hypothetical protein EV378_5366 [Pseudonocardia endophytica]|uniref:Glycosyl transferase family 2 n=2 Tax=Pseudonocardia endophytica TaxID=401976 RepID=A0A4R1HKD2_PSEEN|nr:hypothetical protein EV378_5366 [Pseudonocardia endophytica]
MLSRTGVRQLPSHARLYADAPATRAERMSRGSAPAAIVVPASRPASSLAHLIDVAAQMGAFLVVLCSKQANVDQVSQRMHETLGSRGVAIRVDEYEFPGLTFTTSGPEFSSVNGGRRSDLSMKRNVGLWLARLLGWEKIVFVDDDMTILPSDISRIVHQLDRFPIAGMRSLAYPDNSVVCHARRLARMDQDVFVSGAVLGVNCARRDLAFFPDIYNEDWFFFGEAAATRGLPRPGVAKQEVYDPFDTARAGHEEFGDLLAEGLYSLIEQSGADSFEQVVELASSTYWTDFIDVRHNAILDVRGRLGHLLDRLDYDDRTIHAATVALDSSRTRYDGPAAIAPGQCAEFLERWRKDTNDWRNALPEPMRYRSLAGALDGLQITVWRPVR